MDPLGKCTMESEAAVFSISSSGRNEKGTMPDRNWKAWKEANKAYLKNPV
jgi:hypothetical protein